MNTMRRLTIGFFIWILVFCGTSFYLRAQYLAVPAQVQGLDRPVLSLNGIWQFDPVFHKELIRAGASAADWKEIRVPGEWVMQGFTVEAGRAAAYARDFSVPSSWKGKKVMLRCDAVFSRAQVWINGHYAGSHLGGMTPFELDVTSLLKPGKTNRIVMAVTAETKADTLMSGSQYAAHSLGGILRKIRLYALPPVYAGDPVILTEMKDDFRSTDLVVKGKLYRTGGKKGRAKMHFRLFDPQGVEVTLPQPEKDLLFSPDGSPLSYSFTFPLEEVATWDPEHPRLYRLVMEVTTDGGTERVIRRVGFRRLEVVGNRLFLNGRPLKMHGVNRHETHPLLGRSLNDTLWHLDAQIFKEGNVNYIRTSHYPPAEEFVAWCDSLGLLVELENPFCWVGHGANAAWQKNDPQAPALYDFLQQTAAEVIAFYRDHPSVVIWSMANESAWGPNWERLLRFYRATDPTRPVSFHDQAYGGYNNYGSRDVPIAVYHYPGPDGARVADTFPRPLLFGEYCHINCYNRQEIAADPGVRDAWGRGFYPMWRSVQESAGGLGGAIWAGIDDVFYLPEGRAVGYGEWGVIDGWRREKPEYYHMKKTYAPVRFVNKHMEVPEKGEPVRLLVENYFDFTNLKECTITWEVQGETGTESLSLPPRQAGILAIHPQTAIREGGRMTLTTRSPQNRVVDRTVITFGNAGPEQVPYVPVQGTTLALDSTAGAWLIRGEGFAWQVDRQSGMVTASVGGAPVVTGGPELMMLPLKTGPCVTDYKLDIPPLNDLCRDHKTDSLRVEKKGDTITVTLHVSWYEAYGKMSYRFLPEGSLSVSYDLVSDIKINPRQWGMVFLVTRETEHLAWDRKGLWSIYPEDHIGRTHGEAEPFVTGTYQKPAFGAKPAGPWKDDANALGSNDFRSSKENIYWAALIGGQGRGVLVNGGGKSIFRSWVDGDHISFLVAGFSTGGGDLFFSSHYRDERRPLQRGDRFRGTAVLRLTEKVTGTFSCSGIRSAPYPLCPQQ